MSKYFIVTGGAGFVGSNLIEYLVKKTNFKIISLDNYSSGSKKNHIKNTRIRYINGHTKDINKILNRYKKSIDAIFHFGEFARIYQSFLQMNKCIQSNTIGTNAVFDFCLKNKIKVIYSATSASLGNKGEDKNLSPYAFTKAKNLEMLENLKRWFKFKFEIVYFYNVYGPKQISKGDMATVIGIFENQYKNNKPLTFDIDNLGNFIKPKGIKNVTIEINDNRFGPIYKNRGYVRQQQSIAANIGKRNRERYGFESSAALSLICSKENLSKMNMIRNTILNKSELKKEHRKLAYEYIKYTTDVLNSQHYYNKAQKILERVLMS